MRYLLTISFLLLLCLNGHSQVRNGWRSIYDKEGRLTRMYYYNNGVSVSDSNLFFQYYSENLLKVVVTGEINSQNGNVDGSVSLFDYEGLVNSYHIKRNGQVTFDMDCDYEQNYSGTWSDLFDVETGDWVCDSFSIEKSNLLIHNNSSIAYAIYKPEVPIDIKNDFACKLIIPVANNSAKQGLALCWKNEQNYFLFELLFGKYYNVYYWQNGEFFPVTKGRQLIEKANEDVNELVVRKTGGKLIVEVNGVMEFVYDCPDFTGNTIALVTRSKGDARFSDFIFKNNKMLDEDFFNSKWIGKGTGFFISPTKILTTYEVVMDAKKLRIKGRVDGKSYILPAKIFQLDEENNIAVLQINKGDKKPFATLPYGYTDRAPLSESMALSIGHPNAVGGIYMKPEVFKGQVLSGLASYSNSRLLEMPFRYGMIGSPIFDNDANLIGVCAYKGMDIKYSEMIDFKDNDRLFKANMGKFERKIESPVKNKTTQEKIKALNNVVVLIESNVFNYKE